MRKTLQKYIIEVYLILCIIVDQEVNYFIFSLYCTFSEIKINLHKSSSTFRIMKFLKYNWKYCNLSAKIEKRVGKLQ